MGCNNKSINFFLFVSCMLLSIGALSQDSSNPQFSDYQVPVNNGPFEQNIHFNKEQENYSPHWKNAVQVQLKNLLTLQGTLESIQTLEVMVKNAFVIIGYVVGLLINYQGRLSQPFHQIIMVVLIMLIFLIMAPLLVFHLRWMLIKTVQ